MLSFCYLLRIVFSKINKEKNIEIVMRSGSLGEIETLSLSGDPDGKDLWFQFGMEREQLILSENSMDSLRDLAYVVIETKVSNSIFCSFFL